MATTNTEELITIAETAGAPPEVAAHLEKFGPLELDDAQVVFDPFLESEYDAAVAALEQAGAPPEVTAHLEKIKSLIIQEEPEDPGGGD